MKTTSVLLSLLCASFCSGTPLLSKNLWKTTAGYAHPKDDKKLSLIHPKLSQISAYENVKEKVCPENRASWGVLKHSETGKVFVENDFQTLPWNETVDEANRVIERHELRPSTRILNQFHAPHREMKPFVRCLNHCFDLSTMFENAVQHHTVEKFFLIKSLVDAGFAVNDAVKRRLPLNLKRAIEFDKRELTRALISLGALNAKDEDGRTALHWATMDNSARVVRLLITNGADKDVKNNNGETAFHSAADGNNVEIATILIKNGADKEEKDDRGQTALHIAVSSKNAGFVSFLIENGAEKDAKNKDGQTALQYTAVWNNVKIATILIKNGAGRDEQDNSGRTALHYAVMWPSTEVAKILIENRAHKEVKDDFGRTALHVTADLNKAEVAKILIEKGADKEAKDKDGNTALQVAERKNNEAVERVLIETKADKAEEAKNNQEETALQLAKQENNAEVEKILIETKVEKEAKSKKYSKSRGVTCGLFSCIFKNSNKNQKSKK